ncbi:MAG: diaminopimelate epimerase [Flavobacteriaceae bacterium]|nr:diaminopimelate epimerase [Flavobacteriaceae bacterium]
MNLEFVKYQGAGNDFIVLNNLTGKIPCLDQSTVKRYCDRNFGIGADGLIILEKSTQADFFMKFYNSDGKPSSLCGNGSRCAVKYAHGLSIIGLECTFKAFDGIHRAKILPDNRIRIHFGYIDSVEVYDRSIICDSGSPHYVELVEDLKSIDLIEQARAIRYSNRFKKDGINVNYIQKKSSCLFEIRTYERGVENETLACGTGVVASGVAASCLNLTDDNKLSFQARGGLLEMQFKRVGKGFRDIFLIGEAKEVFRGFIDH